MREKSSFRQQYLDSLVPADNAFALKSKQKAFELNKDGISIGPHEGHLMSFFLRLFKCQRVVELGTLTGYSGLHILSAIGPQGHLWTLELDPMHASIASEIFEEAGYKGLYKIIVGRAEEKLESLLSDGPFDAVFIDANKVAYPTYLDWTLKAIKPGGLIIADNTLLAGVVPEENSTKQTKIIDNLRLFNERLSDPTFFDSILIPTFEGMSIAIKK